MKLFFLGQLGIPVLDQSSLSTSEQRVEALAARLAAQGHEVAVFCAKPVIPLHITSFKGVRLFHRFSLDPGKPGGLAHALRCLLTVWHQQPDVLHIHGWKAAVLTRLAVLVSPQTTLIWTVDTLPTNLTLARIIAIQATRVCDVITVPTRQLQYFLLHHLGLRATYAPDGYEPEVLPNISLSKFRLKRGHYTITTAKTLEELRWVARAYKQSEIKKKLVVLAEKTPALARLSKRYHFLKFVGPQQRRPLTSLIRSASVVIFAGSGVSHQMILQSMDAKRTIVAEAKPEYEELLGTTAQFVRANDVKGLSHALAAADSHRIQRDTKAQKRARAHFQWNRIVSEYLALYHYPLTHAVSIDSVRKPSFTQLPA